MSGRLHAVIRQIDSVLPPGQRKRKREEVPGQRKHNQGIGSIKARASHICKRAR